MFLSLSCAVSLEDCDLVVKRCDQSFVRVCENRSFVHCQHSSILYCQAEVDYMRGGGGGL